MEVELGFEVGMPVVGTEVVGGVVEVKFINGVGVGAIGSKVVGVQIGVMTRLKLGLMIQKKRYGLPHQMGSLVVNIC